ncbi:MAG: metal-dependent phosphohydrolase [Deltaproteobacteria bacterium]|nr:metal-dependent phosphohydrolase [Deltaproteobacteria bacterium]
MQIAIDREKLTELKGWFTKYVHTFRCSDPDKQQNIDLKEEHTMRVCKEISTIGKQLGLNGDELRLAEIIALLHDVGRFEQYTRYHTFIDGKSENHAELGVAIIKRSGILNQLDGAVNNLIIRSIQYHNRHSLPDHESEVCLFFSKLLRDADKLDIWKISTDFYLRKEIKRNVVIGLDLPDTSGFSEEVYHDLINKRIVDIKHVKNLNDFKLLQIGWVFDINYQPTLDRIKERRYLDMIRTVLPESKRIEDIFAIIYVSLFRSSQS